MSKKFKKTGRKALSVFLSTTTVVWLSGAALFVPAAQAATLAELQAMLLSIQAQIAALGGGSSSATQCTFTRSLTVGATGDDVMCLQKYLNSAGHQVSASGAGSPGNETTYFGSRTRAAVAAWQAANGVSPAAGYFGPISQAKYATVAGGTTTTPPPPPGTPPPPAGVGTGLTVSAGTQPAATLAVQSAINVPYTRVRFTASADGDVTVNSLTVERTGLMNDAALSGIILVDENGLRLGNQKTLNSNHQAVLTEPFVVKAGQTREMTLAGDMASSLASYAGQVGFLSLVVVNTSATVNGSLPIAGAGHTVNSSLSIGSVTLAKGSRDPGASNSKEVGTIGYTFSALKATAGSAEDIVWKSIRLNQSGSAGKDDLLNVVVEDTDGNKYPTTVSSDGKYYTAQLGSGITMTKGTSKEVFIKADIVSGSGRTADFDLWKYEDAIFHGKTFNYDIKPSATQTTADDDDDGEFQDADPRYDAYQVTIQKGSLTVQTSGTVGAQNIAAGVNTQVLGAFELEAKGEPITFTSWAITVTTTAGGTGATDDPEIENLTVFNANGDAVAGPKDVKAKAATFTDSVTVPIGKQIYTFKGNIGENWATNSTIQLTFTPSTAISSVTGQVSNNAITPSPSSAVTGPTMTTKAGAVTITPSPAYNNATTTVVSKANNVKLQSFVVDATASGDDVRITVAKMRQASEGATTYVSNLKLMDGTTQLNTGSNVVNPSASTRYTNLTFTLDNNLIVPKGTSKIVDLMGNISSSATTGSNFIFDLSAGTTNNDWTVQTKTQGTSITETLTTTHQRGINVQSAGGWTVVTDSSNPVEKWVPANSKGITLGVLKFNATAEDMALTDLRLQIDTTGSSTGADMTALYLCATSACTGSDLIVKKDFPAFTNGVEDFANLALSGAGSFVIPKDSSRLMTIKVDLAPVGTNLAGIAGQMLGVGYDKQGQIASNNKQMATGKQSGNRVKSSQTADQTSDGVVYFRSVPTVAKLDVPNTKLTSGTQVLYRWSVKADPVYDVAVNRFTFRIATTGITAMGSSLPSFQVYNITETKFLNLATGAAAGYFTITKNYDADPATGNLIVRILMTNGASRHGDYTVPYVTIPAGQTHQFELRGSITTDGTGDSVSTRLLGDTARPVNVVLTGSSSERMSNLKRIDLEQGSTSFSVGANAATSTNFIWTDFASDATSTHSILTADWMNGFRVPGLPLTDGLDATVLSN